MRPGQELLQKWDARARGRHPRLEIGAEDLVLGAIFVLSPDPGLISEGAVPGDPGLRHTIDRDEGTLRLPRQDGEIAALARLALDGIFYETETGIPIARDAGGSVVFDEGTLESAAVPEETSQAFPEAQARCGRRRMMRHQNFARILGRTRRMAPRTGPKNTRRRSAP